MWPFHLRRVRRLFLEGCKHLREANEYWNQAGAFRRGCMQFFCPVPLVSLHEEAKPVYDALLWLERNCRARPLSEDMIHEYYVMVRDPKAEQSTPAGRPTPRAASAPQRPFQGLFGLLSSGLIAEQEANIAEADRAARYRKIAVSVRHGVTPPAKPVEIPSVMKKLGEGLAQDQTRFHGIGRRARDEILKAALEVYRAIGQIRPFPSANGRVARLAMNHLLRRYRLPYVIFPPLSTSPELQRALMEADRSEPARLLELARTFSY